MTLSQSDKDIINFAERKGEFNIDDDIEFDRHIQRIIAWKTGITNTYEPLRYGFPRVFGLKWVKIEVLRDL